jgi:uncharacterized protein YdcH (DUF465 family)
MVTMYPDRSKITEMLRQHNREFKRLEEMHREYEERLEEFTRHAFLTPQQEQMERKIKKQKLHAKDRMAEIIQGYILQEGRCDEKTPPMG